MKKKLESHHDSFEISGEGVDLTTVWRVATRAISKFNLSESARQKMMASRDYIERRVRAGEVIYGVNTGFGAFSSVRISDNEIEQLQRNLIRSHAVGVGPLFSREQVRAIMFLRANALATGHSGIRPQVVEKILECLSNDIIPAIPQQGSVGASGDLAPLSHLALALIGEGEFLDSTGHGTLAATPTLQGNGLTPLTLQAKEGLSLINGCQVMTAVGLLALKRAKDLVLCLDIAGALTVEACQGSRKAFHPLIPSVRQHLGEAKTASNLRKILAEESQISKSHVDCEKVQDAYSLRCMPAVHGAARDTLQRAIEVLEVEANSSTDNPLVFADENLILSCGNFHGEPVAMNLDFAAIAVSELGSISERRIEKLINPALSGLPAFLAPKGGLNSGHMISHVVAASLVSENKILSHPASVDSIPTSADKEDHVSMGTIAARKLEKVVTHVEVIAAIEILAGTQGLDLLAPRASSPGLEAVKSVVRGAVPFATEDRVFGRDIESVRKMLVAGDILATVEEKIGELSF